MTATASVCENAEQDAIEVVENKTPSVNGFRLKAVGMYLRFENSDGSTVKPNQAWGFIRFKPRGQSAFTQHFILVDDTSPAQPAPHAFMPEPEGASQLEHWRVMDNNKKVFKLLQQAIEAHYKARYGFKVQQVHIAFPKG